MVVMQEALEIRLQRLHIRSWRRGMKEMDLILGHFAEGPMALLSPADLDRYEALLQENDQDLYLWITSRIGGGQDAQGPARHQTILAQVAAHAAGRLASP